ncbi:MAG: LapA family protein [Bacteroidota bacterium]
MTVVNSMKEFWLMLSPWQKFKFILTILLSVFVAIFAIVNWQEAEVNFIFFQIKISITLLIVVCLVLGYLSSTIFDYRKHRVKEREIVQLKDKIARLESETISEEK